MKVVVLGAGLTGVTTAWYLAQAGHQVTVADRQCEAGMETSFANGGQISVSHPEPWANPQAPAQILRWMFREDAPLKFRLRADRRQWAWGLRFLFECLPGRARRNADAIARLAVASRAALKDLRAQTGIEYDCRTNGILHLFFRSDGLATASARASDLRRYGIKSEVLSAAECIGLEPALSECGDPIRGGLYAPDDESGDAHQFTRELARLCAGRGVEFLYQSRVTGWDYSQGRIYGVQVSQPSGLVGTLRADAIVICMGSYSPLLAGLIGERLPIYPVKGYSVTLPVENAGATPALSITDEAHRIVISRLGERLRIAGTAELDGYNVEVNARRCEAIVRRAARLLPGAVDAAKAECWAGLRPSTPGNVPIIGRGRAASIYFNTGHGTLGWTLACGSARAITDIIGGATPQLPFPYFGMRGPDN